VPAAVIDQIFGRCGQQVTSVHMDTGTVAKVCPRAHFDILLASFCLRSLIYLCTVLLLRTRKVCTKD